MPPSLGAWLGLDSNQTYRSEVDFFDPEASLAPQPLTPKHTEQQKKKLPAQKSAAVKNATPKPTPKRKPTQKPGPKPAVDRKKAPLKRAGNQPMKKAPLASGATATGKKTPALKKSATTQKSPAHSRQLDAAAGSDSQITRRPTSAELASTDTTTVIESQFEASAATNNTVEATSTVDALRTEDEEARKLVWTLSDVAKRLMKQSASSKTATKWQELLDQEEAKMGTGARRRAEEIVVRLEASIEKLRGICARAAVPLS